MLSYWKRKAFFLPRIWRAPIGCRYVHWGVFRGSELEELVGFAHRLIMTNCPKRPGCAGIAAIGAAKAGEREEEAAGVAGAPSR